jgi:hypothetical protein
MKYLFGLRHSINHLKFAVTSFTTLLVLISYPAIGADKGKGFEIAALSDRSDRGFSDSRVKLEMLLRNAAGRENRRSLELTTLEIPDESVGDRRLIVFSFPRDIDGTALLSHAKILQPDDQWFYLPAL